MAKIKFILIGFILFAIGAKAQINLVGASVGLNGTIDIVKWQALDSNTVETYPTNLQGYQSNSIARPVWTYSYSKSWQTS